MLPSLGMSEQWNSLLGQSVSPSNFWHIKNNDWQLCHNTGQSKHRLYRNIYHNYNYIMHVMCTWSIKPSFLSSFKHHTSIETFSLPIHTFSLLCFNFTAHSGSTHELYQSAPSQDTQRQTPQALEKLMLPKNLTLARMKELEFDCSGGKYYSPEDDYSLTVPKGAIPEKLGSVSIQCGVIPYGPFGPFKYPDGIKPVSPIVWFCMTTKVKFQKPVEITIPHCLDCDSEKDSQSLAFFKADHNVSDSGPIARVFHFKETEGTSSFLPNTSHGTLHSKHLCFYCIGSKDKEITERANFCLITAEPKCFQRISRIHFCLTYLLKTCMQVNNKQVLILMYICSIDSRVGVPLLCL